MRKISKNNKKEFLLWLKLENININLSLIEEKTRYAILKNEIDNSLSELKVALKNFENIIYLKTLILSKKFKFSKRIDMEYLYSLRKIIYEKFKDLSILFKIYNAIESTIINNFQKKNLEFERKHNLLFEKYIIKQKVI